MATLKSKHLVLYFITFALLYFSQIPGGALLSLAAWMQICVLLWNMEFNAKNQITMFLYFLTLVPLFFFLGSCSSFVNIYLNEGSLLFFGLISIMTLIICFLTVLFAVNSFRQNISNYNVAQIYSASMKSIATQKKELAATSFCFFILIILPVPMQQDYKIASAIILIHLYLRRTPVQKLFS